MLKHLLWALCCNINIIFCYAGNIHVSHSSIQSFEDYEKPKKESRILAIKDEKHTPRFNTEKRSKQQTNRLFPKAEDAELVLRDIYQLHETMIPDWFEKNYKYMYQNFGSAPVNFLGDQMLRLRGKGTGKSIVADFKNSVKATWKKYNLKVPDFERIPCKQRKRFVKEALNRSMKLSKLLPMKATLLLGMQIIRLLSIEEVQQALEEVGNSKDYGDLKYAIKNVLLVAWEEMKGTYDGSEESQEGNRLTDFVDLFRQQPNLTHGQSSVTIEQIAKEDTSIVSDTVTIDDKKTNNDSLKDFNTGKADHENSNDESDIFKPITMKNGKFNFSYNRKTTIETGEYEYTLPKNLDVETTRFSEMCSMNIKSTTKYKFQKSEFNYKESMFGNTQYQPITNYELPQYTSANYNYNNFNSTNFQYKNIMNGVENADFRRPILRNMF